MMAYRMANPLVVHSLTVEIDAMCILVTGRGSVEKNMTLHV